MTILVEDHFGYSGNLQGHLPDTIGAATYNLPTDATDWENMNNGGTPYLEGNGAGVITNSTWGAGEKSGLALSTVVMPARSYAAELRCSVPAFDGLGSQTSGISLGVYKGSGVDAAHSDLNARMLWSLAGVVTLQPVNGSNQNLGVLTGTITLRIEVIFVPGTTAGYVKRTSRTLVNGALKHEATFDDYQTPGPSFFGKASFGLDSADVAITGTRFLVETVDEGEEVPEEPSSFWTHFDKTHEILP